jgi:hypothetical protein
MARKRRHTVAFWICAAAMHASLPAVAADVGGFYADQQKARELAASKDKDDSCPQLIARAAKEDSALAAYRAALCYLQAEPPELIAAKAWLARSTDLGFMPAQRLLRSLLIAEAGLHGPGPHCHSLGEGQQLCHGGAARLPLAAAVTN